jgi:hypothetical protein
MKQPLPSAQHAGQVRQGQGDEQADIGADGEDAEKGVSLNDNDHLLPCRSVMSKAIKTRNSVRQHI